MTKLEPGATLTRASRTFGVCFAPDGDRIAVAGYQAVAMWRPWRKKPLVWERAMDEVDPSSVVFFPDGASILVGGVAHRVVAMDSTTGKITATHACCVMSLGLSPDGMRFIAGGRPDVEVWTIGPAMRTAMIRGKQQRHPNSAKNAAFLDDDTVMFTAMASLSVWKLGVRPTELMKVSGGKFGISAAPRADGTIVSIDLTGRLCVWDHRARGTKRRLVDHRLAPRTSVLALALSPDGTRACYGEQSGRITMVDVATGSALAVLSGHDDAVDAIAFSPDGTQLVSSSLDMNIHAWRLG